MKRYNIHIATDWMEVIEKIRQELIKGSGEKYYAYGLTRADLIRIAIGEYFGFAGGYAHLYGEEWKKALTKIIKKRVAEKGV